MKQTIIIIMTEPSTTRLMHSWRREFEMGSINDER
jgi:hypothetical protein